MYTTLKTVHILCAMLTIAGFSVRGYWMMVEPQLLSGRLIRVAPHIIDTVFLLSGIAMLVMLSLNPLTQTWRAARAA